MKKENHQWRRDIEYFLWKIGYGNIWLSPEKLSKARLKLSLTHSLLKMPGGTYLGYSRHLYRMSICCSFMIYAVCDFVCPNFHLKMRLE